MIDRSTISRFDALEDSPDPLAREAILELRQLIEHIEQLERDNAHWKELVWSMVKSR